MLIKLKEDRKIIEKKKQKTTKQKTVTNMTCLFNYINHYFKHNGLNTLKQRKAIHKKPSKNKNTQIEEELRNRKSYIKLTVNKQKLEQLY